MGEEVKDKGGTRDKGGGGWGGGSRGVQIKAENQTELEPNLNQTGSPMVPF